MFYCSHEQVNTLVEYYRQLAQKEKIEREKKKLTKRRNYMHLSVSTKGMNVRNLCASCMLYMIKEN